MNYINFILPIGIIVSIIYSSIKKGNKLVYFIILLQAISISIALFINKTISFHIWGLSLLASFIYPFIKNMNKQKRALLLFFVAPLLVLYIFQLFNWSSANFIQTTMLVPIVIFIFVLFKKSKEFRQEIGFMISLALFALLNFLQIFI